MSTVTEAVPQTASEAPVDYQKLHFGHRRAKELDGNDAVIHPVVIVGAGPIGLATAIDLALHDVPCVLVDDDDTLSVGSRALCFSKRALEILDRLGCGQRMVDKGVSWNVGKVFFGDEMLYSFNLLPEAGHARPAFINLQQYYLEGYLVERAQQFNSIDLRWKSEVTNVVQKDDHVVLTIGMPEGEYTLRARYVIAADGARSPVRQALGLDSHGRIFRDRFLIADVKMKAPFPAERWFWFDPAFNPDQSVLLHQQPDGVWRIDFQLGWDADPVAEKDPARVIPRVKALLGKDAEFDLEWVSVYTFACERMDSFREGRVLFAGDAAHRVSPFGARGANSGFQDVENLAWKLQLVLNGEAPDALLDTYCEERQYAADENILNSTRATDFITPKSAVSRTFRDAALHLAKTYPFARRLVNSGRLSVPAVLRDSPLNFPDQAQDHFAGNVVPGTVVPDAPVRVNGHDGWLLDQTSRHTFTGICFCAADEDPASLGSRLKALARQPFPVQALVVMPPHANVNAISRTLPEYVKVIEDRDGLLAQRLDAQPGSLYLLRPDQHLCARWRTWSDTDVTTALNRATCNG